jgi:hypothetical protein
MPLMPIIQTTCNLAKFFQEMRCTAEWKRGEISNFAYLIKLNIFSGRTFNDPSQYPLFPWVLADYTSAELNLSSDESYRDLTKPIGAIGETRLDGLLRRMEEVTDEPQYLFSSYAICPLHIYLWLIREEPFTSLHILIQNGKFDHANRIFASVNEFWMAGLKNFNNYRELVPEFYFSPDFLVNENGFDFGETSRKQKVCDVELPSWAHGSPFEFIYLMRKAMESDYVSANLNHWIDLVWGYKQRGPEAMKSFNVYKSDLYDSIWTSATLSDPLRRGEIEAAMMHVGQIPPQMFTKRHPSRIRKQISPQISQTLVISFGSKETARAAYVSACSKTEIQGKICIDRSIFKLRLPVAEKVQLVKRENVVLVDEPVLTFASEDIFLLESGTVLGLQNLSGRASVVSSDNGIIAIVVDDATLVVINPNTRFTIPFYGEVICCCAVSETFKIAVCGTIAGHLVIISVYNGTKVNVVDLQGLQPILVAISPGWGFIVAHGISQNRERFLTVHSVNGKFIRKVRIPFRIRSWCCWSSRESFDYLVMGSDDGKVFVTEVFYCDIKEAIHRGNSPVLALTYHLDCAVAIAVHENGSMAYIPCLNP